MAKKRKDFRIYNVRDIVAIEERDRTKMSLTDKLADRVTAFSGSMIYVLLHGIWFAIWILVNSNIIPGVRVFDPFPFSFLTMIVSLEAIFLSTFVLISQNKQAIQADKRAKIDLQVNLIAERENTKLINMIIDIQKHLGMRKKYGPEIRELRKSTDISKLATQIDKAEKKLLGKNSRGPRSAADTSK